MLSGREHFVNKHVHSIVTGFRAKRSVVEQKDWKGPGMLPREWNTGQAES